MIMKQLILIALVLFASFYSFAQDKHHCASKTKAGTQCMHKTTTTYCKQHDPASIRCGAPTKTGGKCQRVPKKGETKCFQHKIVLIKSNYSKDGISVVYVSNNDTLAFDYLTRKEYDSLQKSLLEPAI